AIDLGLAEAGLQRRGDAERDMLGRLGVAAERTVAALRPQVIAGLAVDQPKSEPRLLPLHAQAAAQAIARRARLAGDGDAGTAQRSRQRVGHAAGGVLGARRPFDG